MFEAMLETEVQILVSIQDLGCLTPSQGCLVLDLQTQGKFRVWLWEHKFCCSEFSFGCRTSRSTGSCKVQVLLARLNGQRGSTLTTELTRLMSGVRGLYELIKMVISIFIQATKKQLHKFTLANKPVSKQAQPRVDQSRT